MRKLNIDRRTLDAERRARPHARTCGDAAAGAVCGARPAPHAPSTSAGAAARVGAPARVRRRLYSQHPVHLLAAAHSAIVRRQPPPPAVAPKTPLRLPKPNRTEPNRTDWSHPMPSTPSIPSTPSTPGTPAAAQPTIAALVAPAPVSVSHPGARAGASPPTPHPPAPPLPLDTTSLRRLFRQTPGIGTTPSAPPWARALGWQALLHTLPAADKTQWPAALAKQRAQYYVRPDSPALHDVC